MREITLNDWIKEGHGFSADSYKNKYEETKLLKLFFTSDGKSIAENEYNTAINVIKMGLPTPKIFEIVKVDDMTGIIYERILQKKSFGRLCESDPENLPKYAKIFARTSKKLHTTKCDKTVFPPRTDFLNRIINETKVSEEIKGYLRKLLENLEETDTCLHGDLQTGNIVQGWCNGYEGREKKDGEELKEYFIDLGTFSYGNPVLDIAELYLSTQIYHNEESNINLLHMTPSMAQDFWKYYIPEYIGSDDPDKIKAFEDKVAPYAIFFILCIIDASDGNEHVINTGLRHINELYNKYKDI